MNTSTFDAVIAERFEQIANRYPEEPAVQFGPRVLTYRELDCAANRLAHFLRKRGVRPGSLVGVCVSRSPEMIVSVLAVLKAGGAYVPLDPEYPAARLTYMLENARAELLLTEAAQMELFSAMPVECIDVNALDLSAEPETPLPLSATADNLVYVIYTSGSTGNPKGVAMPNRPLVNLVDWQIEESGFEPGARTLQFSPLSFDVSFQEIFSTLCAGGTLVLIDDNERLDPGRLVAFLNDHRVERLFLPFVALQYLAETAVSRNQFPASLREVITAGEQLQVNRHIVEFFNAMPDCKLFNHYGPTEAHVVTRYKLEGAPDTWPPLPSIGTAIPNTQMHILDANMQPVADGETGELYIGGIALADGYLHQPELTAERFIPDPFGGEGGRLYKTGDLARFLPDGNIEFLGRADDQVKVRGYRIELGEIDAVLSSHEAVKQAVTSPWEQQPGSAALAAYLLPKPGATPSVQELRRYAEEKLPDYMVPSAFILVEDYPLTPSGKVDRRALPKPTRDRPVLDTDYIAPATPWQETLSSLWKEVLGMDTVGVRDSFFDLGGTSLLLLRLISLLRERQGVDLPVATFFQHPTITALANIIEQSGERESAAGRARERAQRLREGGGDDVAIIGWAGRFPGASDVDTFWKNLCEGQESITFFEDDELDASIDPELKNDPDYVKARGVLEGAEHFDAAFFGFTPREAELMDPQQRLLLEIAWHALEHAGCTATEASRLVGVYAGMGNSTYYRNNVLTRPDRCAELGEFQVMTGNEKDYIATRIAYKLNLTGPAVSVHTACSTSLVAITQAFHALRSGQCDVALAGGVSINTPQKQGYLYQEGSMLSPDGHTRPFDADAQGTTFNSGAALIVVKRLHDALAAGDRVYAVIRGAALNNDGGDKMSFSAPSVDGQSAVVAMAQVQAGVEPDTIGYIEAHGTGTPVGDPIEVSALTQAFRAGTDRKQFCALGSLKGNTGHLICAAGVSGVIKAALALHHKKIPGTLHFKTPNPQLDLENSPFYVNRELMDWPGGDTPRRAGVTSLGVGGTNAHVILEEAPEQPLAAERPSRPRQLLLLSAKTGEALDAASANLATRLKEQPETDLADTAYTLATARRRLAHRRCLVCGSNGEAVDVLEKRLPKQVSTHQVKADSPPLVFLFPGQGAQYVNMGRNLYETEPVFKEALDRCADILKPVLDIGLLDLLFPTIGNEEEAAARLQHTRYTQPAVFSIEVSLAQLWMSWGLKPAALAGHSIGEFAAACIAGVFALDDALPLVAKRGAMMQALPEGAMLSVRASYESIKEHLPDKVWPAALNAPELCVVSGAHEDVDKAINILEARGVQCSKLRTSHAFHSPMMDCLVEPFADEVKKLKLNAPQIPFVSSVTGEWITAEQATDPMYWARHLREPVNFTAVSSKLWKQPDRVLLEVGPGGSCTALSKSARRSDVPARDQMAIASLGHSAEDNAEWTALLLALGQLWTASIECDWTAFYARETRQRIPLPGYPFESKRHWLEPGARDGSFLPPESGAAVAEEEEDGLSPRERLVSRILSVLEETSGEDFSDAGEDVSFMEMGFDSLFLTQASLAISNRFKVKVTFRQLMENLSTLKTLADYIEKEMPAEKPPASAAAQTAPFAAPEPEPEEDAPKKPFGAGARIATVDTDVLTDRQRAAFERFSADYIARTSESKKRTEANRSQLADPRVVSGFRPLMKELVYPILVNRSEGSRLWDVDGNEYIDLTCGFGSNFFGNGAPFLVKAIEKQLHQGYEIGPQHPLAGEVSKLFCEMTGLDRAAFCNTGSEAVLGAMRLARTVTGRQTVAMFTGDYHGICDEVIVRGTSSLRSLPAAPGIPPSAVANVLVLDYGDEKSLEILRERGSELAAIMVEPVQSRCPDLQPRDFLHECRKIADACGAAFIMDEVITGFRVHPRGAQGMFDLKADIATYGKVVGGGMPIGVIGGVRRFMDALDGGQWQFGDHSFPEVGVTYFAGTFVRHPLTMAAAKAALLYMKEQGPQLQETLNARTKVMVDEINEFSAEHGAALKIKRFGSLCKITFTREEPFADLFHAWLRHKGLHAWDARPTFLTLAHSDADVARIVRVFKETIEEMQSADLLSKSIVPQTRIEVDGTMVVPTTEAQREMLAAMQLNEQATLAYNESVSLRLHGQLNLLALQKAVSQAVARHDALRSTFSADGTVMRIHPAADIQLDCVDCSQDDARLAAMLAEEVETPFDLDNGPVIRFRLAGLSAQEFQLIITAHHLVCDGWSIDVLVRDIGQFYSAAVDETRLDLPVADRFADYAGMEPEWLQNPECRAAEAWWIKRFEGEVPVMDMPSDRPRPPVRSFAGAREDFRLDPELTARLKEVGRGAGCTFVNLLLAAFKVFIHRHTGQTDLVTGLPSAGQSVRDCENLVGHCVNLMPLRTQLDPQMPFSEFLKQLRRDMLDAVDHSYFTFGTLVKKLNLPRDLSRVPLVPLVFNIDNGIDLSTIRYAGLTFEFISNPRHYENFEIFLNAMDLPDGRTAVEWSYNRGLFDAETIRRFMAEFETLLRGIAADPQTVVSDLPLMPEAERSLLLNEWSGTKCDYPRDASIHALFEAQAKAAPDAPALQSADGEVLRYGELNARANRVAHLLAGRGVRAGDCVGLCFERSVDMTIALLGILKAGAAYVPLDTAYPPERLSHILTDTGMNVILCQKGRGSELPMLGNELLELNEEALSEQSDENPALNVGAMSPAYVMYTSGSTGTPKGVVVPHRGVVRLVKNTNYVELNSDTCTLHFAPIAFDASTFELWAALLNGGKVVLYPPQAPSLEELGRVIREGGVNTLWLTADLFRAMVAERLDDLRGVKQLLAGGDVLSVPEVKRVLSELDGCCLINGYGPTENTTFTCCCPLTSPDDFSGSVPIGKPVANTSVYILDEKMNPVPVGVTGELYTGGDGLAIGYLNQPELTAEKFVDNPFDPGARLYRTGDRARWMSDGRIEFQGRQDRQVKVRGFRIELDGIEHVLSQHEALAQVAVTAPEVQAGRRALAAYYSFESGKDVSREDLRTWLGSCLPDYMIPQYFTPMEQLPLSSAGKINRRALPVPDSGMHAGCAQFTAPRTPEEETLAGIWCSVLGLEKISVCDNFFDLGGHSLLAIQLMDRLGEAGYDARVEQLFQFPTVEELSQVLTSRQAVKSEDERWFSLVTLRRGNPDKPPLFFLHTAPGDVLMYSNLIHHLPGDQPCYAFQSLGLHDVKRAHRTIEEMCAHYASLLNEFYPDGPVMLCGWCFGGTLAAELAMQLKAQGREVSMLAVLDVWTHRPADWKLRLNYYRQVTRLFSVMPWERKKSFVTERIRNRISREVRPESVQEALQVEVKHGILKHRDEIYKINLLATQRYRSRFYDGKVCFFRPDWIDHEFLPDLLLGWGLISAEQDAFLIPGGHRTILTEPNVQILARYLTGCIEKAAVS